MTHYTRRGRSGSSRVRGALALLPLALAAPACGGDDDAPTPPEPVCEIDYLGEEGADIELEVIALEVSSKSRPIGEGDRVDITTPPQGGRVLFVGARARNLSACGVKLKGVLRDPESMRVMYESRTINLQRAEGGWGASVDSDISTFTNIAVCPNQWSSRDVFDQDYELEVQLKDKLDRSATKSFMVRPACSEPELEAECRCLCKNGYKLGEACH
jgi:hypothetical protein